MMGRAQQALAVGFNRKAKLNMELTFIFLNNWTHWQATMSVNGLPGQLIREH